MSAFNRFAAAGLLIAGFCLLFGCAGVRGPSRAISEGQLSPTQPAATSYASDATRACPNDDVLRRLLSGLESQAKKTGKPAPQANGQLCSVAGALLEWGRPEAPPESVINFVSWYFGLPAPGSRVIVTFAGTDDAEAIATSLVEPLSRFAAIAAQPRFGLATLRSEKGLVSGSRRLRETGTKLALVMQDGLVDLNPVPRRVDQKGEITVSGKLLGNLENAKVLACSPTGRLERQDVPSGSAFQAKLHCGDLPGLTQIEIFAEQKGANVAVASFPVACGIDLPTSVAVQPPAPATADVAKAERRLFELINGERQSSGIAALEWHDTAAKVARGIATETREQARRGGSVVVIDPVERLKKAGTLSSLVLQNPGQARTAEAAHERFSSSAVHRCNYLTPEATHTGIGVVPGGESENPTVFVAELFIRELATLNIASVREKLRAAIAQRRSEAGVPPISSDPILEKVAQQYAEELAAAKGNLSNTRANEIVTPMHKTFRKVEVLAGVKGDPIELAQEPGVVVTGKVFGIGVAQGDHSTVGKNAAYVALLIGSRR